MIATPKGDVRREQVRSGEQGHRDRERVGGERGVDGSRHRCGTFTAAQQPLRLPHLGCARLELQFRPPGGSDASCARAPSALVVFDARCRRSRRNCDVQRCAGPRSAKARGPSRGATRLQGATNATATATPIKHVIVIIGENHTFDNVYGTYQPPKGQTVRNLLSEKSSPPRATPGPTSARRSNGRRWTRPSTRSIRRARALTRRSRDPIPPTCPKPAMGRRELIDKRFPRWPMRRIRSRNTFRISTTTASTASTAPASSTAPTSETRSTASTRCTRRSRVQRTISWTWVHEHAG